MIKKDLGLVPNARVIQAIHNLTCARVANIAKYIAYRTRDPIKFGNEDTTVVAFCQKWATYNAHVFAVKVWCGPPGQEEYRRIPLSSYVLDWYFRAIAIKNHHMVQKFEDMLL